MACDENYVRQKSRYNDGKRKKLSIFPGCEWVGFSKEEALQVDLSKKKFARKTKHKAEEWQGSEARNYVMSSRIANNSAWLWVQKAEKWDGRVFLINMSPVKNKEGLGWYVSRWNEVFRSSDSFDLVSPSWPPFPRSLWAPWPLGAALACILSSRKGKGKENKGPSQLPFLFFKIWGRL